jgi:hypothetical protein
VVSLSQSDVHSLDGFPACPVYLISIFAFAESFLGSVSLSVYFLIYVPSMLIVFGLQPIL